MRMEAPEVMHVLYCPRDLSPDRFHRWCEERTRLQVERAKRKGKRISGANVRRMLARRTAGAVLRPDVLPGD